jgi:hypothetical protein
MTPPRWVSDASVVRESSALGEGCWSGTTVASRRFAFWKASCALSVHSNVFGLPFRAQYLCAIRQKTAVEIHHGEKMLQLLDVLRGGACFDGGGVIGLQSRSCRRNVEAKNSKVGTAKTHLSKLIARPLAANAAKNASKWRRCVSLSRDPTLESSMYGNVPSRPSKVRSIMH